MNYHDRTEEDSAARYEWGFGIWRLDFQLLMLNGTSYAEKVLTTEMRDMDADIAEED